MKNKKNNNINFVEGIINIYSTKNNTIITITTKTGDVISWASTGSVGFKGARKSTPFAAQVAAENAILKALNFGVKDIDVFVKGDGPGREAAIQAIKSGDFIIKSIQDKTPIPHNGCRPPKNRKI